MVAAELAEDEEVELRAFSHQAARFGVRPLTDDVTRIEVAPDGGVHKLSPDR